jgi:hypothetical protein
VEKPTDLWIKEMRKRRSNRRDEMAGGIEPDNSSIYARNEIASIFFVGIRPT